MKTKTVLISTLALALLLFLSCSDDKGTEPNENLTELEGTWIGYELDGEPGDWTFSFSGNEGSVHNHNYEESYSGTFTINSQTSPKQIDLTIEECSYSPFIGETSLGIYEIEDNTLTFAGCEPGENVRPTTFSTEGNPRVYILNKQ